MIFVTFFVLFPQRRHPGMFAPMTKAKSPFSTDTFLTVLGILVGACALLFEQWAVKAPTALFAIGLIVYAGRRHGSHPLIRYPVALAAIAVFAFLPWDDIWADFHKNHPATAWLEFVTWQSFHWALALAATVALGWDWLPFWHFRHRFYAPWRRLLSEETWVNRADAIKLVQASEWAKLREPIASFADQLGLSASFGMTSDYQRDRIRFGRFIRMVLDRFEQSNPSYVRTVESKQEYLEQKLQIFLEHALDNEVLERFGKLPGGQV